jgi:uncharacterized protein (DUF1015 family)
MQEAYYKKSEFNFVRLILNKDENPYASSKAACEKWLAGGELRRDEAPSIYPYRQVFTINGHRRVRRGLTCLCKLEPFGEGMILPHERTLSKPKEDRLNLMRATRKQFEQVFMLYSDVQDRVNKILAPIWKWKPEFQVTDEYGTTHCLWAVSDQKTIHAVETALRAKLFVIADGHHRYETALNYRDEMSKKLGKVTGREAFNYRLVTCVNLNDKALIILPTHRLLRNLAELNLNDLLTRAQKHFETNKIPAEAIEKKLAAPARRRDRITHSFIMYGGSEKVYEFVLRTDPKIDDYFPAERSPDYRELDVAILHTVVLENLLGIKPEVIEEHVSYEREWKTALEQVNAGSAQLAFLIHPTRAEQVRNVAEKKERMPQKSTDFFPKLISGLVFFDTNEKELIEEG